MYPWDAHKMFIMVISWVYHSPLVTNMGVSWLDDVPLILKNSPLVTNIAENPLSWIKVSSSEKNNFKIVIKHLKILNHLKIIDHYYHLVMTNIAMENHHPPSDSHQKGFPLTSALSTATAIRRVLALATARREPRAARRHAMLPATWADADFLRDIWRANNWQDMCS